MLRAGKTAALVPTTHTHNKVGKLQQSVYSSVGPLTSTPENQWRTMALVS